MVNDGLIEKYESGNAVLEYRVVPEYYVKNGNVSIESEQEINLLFKNNGKFEIPIISIKEDMRFDFIKKIDFLVDFLKKFSFLKKRTVDVKFKEYSIADISGLLSIYGCDNDGKSRNIIEKLKEYEPTSPLNQIPKDLQSDIDEAVVSKSLVGIINIHSDVTKHISNKETRIRIDKDIRDITQFLIDYIVNFNGKSAF